MWAFIKLIFGVLMLAGLSAFLTTYGPSLWNQGFDIPVINIGMSYAVAILLSAFILFLWKVKLK
jgi:hypothetical protein